MIGHFPTPYPDELLYSICARLQDRLQYPSRMSFADELFGNKHARAVVDIPSRLGYLFRALPSGHRLTVDRLIDEHTLFPYFGPFLTLERMRRVRRSMEGEESLLAKISSGSSCNKSIRKPDWLRFCPQCYREDITQYGESYWHRLHQIPGVEVCPAHFVYLENSHAGYRNCYNHQEYVSADRAIPDIVSRSLDLFNTQHKILSKIAVDAAWLLNQRNLCPGFPVLHLRFTRLLVDQDMGTPSGWTKNRLLIQALEDYFTPSLLELLQCGINKQYFSNWALVFLPNLNIGKFQHPLRHLLLMQLLGHTAETFFALPTEYQPFGLGPWPCLNPVCEDYGKPVITECELWHTHRDSRRIPVGTFTCKCGFAYNRKEDDKSLDDIFRFHRVKTYGVKWETTLTDLWSSSLFLQDIALRLCGSRNSTIRIKTEAERLGLPFPRRIQKFKIAYKYKRKKYVPRPPREQLKESFRDTLRKYRKEWQEILKQHSGKTRTQLTTTNNRLYRWLNKNDREWFQRHLPPRKDHTFDWESLDISLEEKVKQSAIQLKHSSSPLRRISVYLIGKDINGYEYLRKNLDKLPKTSKILKKVVETQLDFVLRKLQVAAEFFRANGDRPSPWKLMCMAKILQHRNNVEVKTAINTTLESF
jgi:hypothetical protein